MIFTIYLLIALTTVATSLKINVLLSSQNKKYKFSKSGFLGIATYFRVVHPCLCQVKLSISRVQGDCVDFAVKYIN